MTLRLHYVSTPATALVLLAGCTSELGSDATSKDPTSLDSDGERAAPLLGPPTPEHSSEETDSGVTPGVGGIDASGEANNSSGASTNQGTGGNPAGPSTGAGGTVAPPTASLPLKGIAGASPCEDLDRVGASWFYTWGLRSNCDPGDHIEYVPMIWGAGSADQASSTVTDGATHLLGFNEPERADQANMSVGQALSLWPQLEATGLRLGSPATASSPDGEEWLNDFMTQAEAQGHRVDFVAVHWYGWGEDGCNNIDAHFTGYMERVMSYGLPVWITEWGCYNESEADALAFYEAATEWLGAQTLVERYAWFLTRAGEQHGAAWDAQNLVTPTGGLTPLGQSFQASPAYR